MAYTTIDDPSAYFTTVLSTSTGSALTIDTGFKPDWLWTKARNFARSHELHDTTRGDNKRLKSDATTAEESYSNYLTFTSTGATFGTNHNLGYHAEGATTGVSWAWKANGGTTASNTDGSITSTVQANTTAGFSIVTYTGNGTNGAFVGHGLGVTPNIVIIKNRSAADAWRVGFSAFSNDLVLNDTSASAAYSAGRIGDLSSTKFELGGSGSFDSTNVNGENYVAYCFAPIQGYSKFGSYTGNGNADGPFIYTGFKPAWFMLKATDDSGRNWIIHNSKMAPTNVAENELIANLNDAEVDNGRLDILSNGIKLRSTSLASNKVNINYIYMAFAESPFVSSKGVPTTAR